MEFALADAAAFGRVFFVAVRLRAIVFSNNSLFSRAILTCT